MKCLCIFLCVLILVFGKTNNQEQTCFPVEINWSNVLQVSKTITTLQVVANPLLNPQTCPVAATAWESLSNLNAEMVRYVPWFPYPRVGVAELDPPNGTAHWDFTYINPQFDSFMKSVSKTTIPNFSTQPTWMYDTKDWSYPSNPNAVAWNYPRGNALPTTTQKVAEYYGRLLSWMILGKFTDEYGVVHNNGHFYNITHWEVFNEPEGCHGLNYQQYTVQYDAVVKEIRRVADPQKKIKFLGLALAGREMDWISYFLNPANHDPAALPLDYISFHFYASCSSRTDPNTYEQFFPAADGFLGEARQIMDIKNKINPTVKLDVDEMGVILPDDNNNNAPVPPRVYWNAAGAMYAYLFSNMALMGYDVLGESQLAGSPPIPQWGIPDAQFPSVSMLNWTTGEGNARYWVLKLLIESFKVGDRFVNTSVPGVATSPMCGFVNGHAGYGSITLTCAASSAVINDIQFAAFGTPTGTCGNYKHNPTCDAKNVTDYVKSNCIGKSTCSILSYPTFGDPCYGVYKDLVIQATCSGNQGGYANPPASGVQAPHAQAIITSTGRKILLVNKLNQQVCVNIPGVAGSSVLVVDEQSGDGPARGQSLPTNNLTLNPFAVAVITVQ